jgi:hypothetical protein
MSHQELFDDLFVHVRAVVERTAKHLPGIDGAGGSH